MDKKEIEQILIIVKSGEQEALNMKIYKNGTLCRRGVGGLPEIGISAMSFTDSAVLFNEMIELVPQELLNNPVNYEDPKIDTSLEYIVAFYGVSKNGETGEHAEWTKSTGIRLLLDSNTSFRHAILSFVDTFSLEAADKTNPWYFDAIIEAVYKLKSETLPQTILAVPKTEQEIKMAFENYVNQVIYSSRKWDLTSFPGNKVYTDTSGNKFHVIVIGNQGVYNFEFVPAIESITGSIPDEKKENKVKKKWWKF